MYGAGAVDWPSWRKAEAWEDVEHVMAWHRLHDPRVTSEMRAYEVYDLVLAATKSEDKALAASRVRADARMAANKEP